MENCGEHWNNFFPPLILHLHIILDAVNGVDHSVTTMSPMTGPTADGIYNVVS